MASSDAFFSMPFIEVRKELSIRLTLEPEEMSELNLIGQVLDWKEGEQLWRDARNHVIS
jgi:hypothetical protein